MNKDFLSTTLCDHERRRALWISQLYYVTFRKVNYLERATPT